METKVIIELAIHAIAAIGIGLFAWVVERFIKRVESSHWLNQKIIERRLEIYDKVMPKLNDLLCYYTRVGNWKELTPVSIIQLKRELDKIMYVDKALFSEQLFKNYLELIELCFETFTGKGNDAKLRTKPDHRRDLPNWLPEYETMFSSPDKCCDKEKLKIAYDGLVLQFSVEFGLRQKKRSFFR